MKHDHIGNLIDLSILQTMQDQFSAITQVPVSIKDLQGNAITLPSDPLKIETDNILLAQLLEGDIDGQMHLAPIEVNDKQLGYIEFDEKLYNQRSNSERAAASLLLYLMANGIGRMCLQESKEKVLQDELDVLFKLSKLLAENIDLQKLLDIAAESVAELMGVRSANIRLLTDDGKELVSKSSYNLSKTYMDKGPLLVSNSPIYQKALSGEIVYVENMSQDTQVLYSEFAEVEGIKSILCAAMVYNSAPIGVIRLYTNQVRHFSRNEKSLLKAISRLMAAAIVNGRLIDEYIETQDMQRQIQMATLVQRRMLPRQLPDLAKFDIAVRYEPSYELAGDFYDFIKLDNQLGVAVGDLVGKGIAASLLMASTRATLRAYTDDITDIREIVSKVNISMYRDTKDYEFATLFYGVINPDNMTLTYSNCGHDPVLLVRNNKITKLITGGMVLGVDVNQRYETETVKLKKNDILLIYSDGLPDAMNFEDQRFGRSAINKALLERQNEPAKAVLDHVFWEMRRHTGLRQLTDDTTIMVIKVR